MLTRHNSTTYISRKPHPHYQKYSKRVLGVQYAMDEDALLENDTTLNPQYDTNVAIKVIGMEDITYRAFLKATPYANHTEKTYLTFLGLSQSLVPKVEGLPPKLKDMPYTHDRRGLQDLNSKVNRDLLTYGRAALVADTRIIDGKAEGYFTVFNGLHIFDWSYGITPDGTFGLIYLHLLTEENAFSRVEGHYTKAKDLEYMFDSKGRAILRTTTSGVISELTHRSTKKTTVNEVVLQVGGSPLKALPVEIINWDNSSPCTPPKPPLQNIASLSIKTFIIKFWQVIGIYATLPVVVVFSDTDRETIQSDVTFSPTVVNVLGKEDRVEVLESSSASQKDFKSLEDSLYNDILSAGSKLFGDSDTVGSENANVFSMKTKIEFSSLTLLQKSFANALQRLMPVFLQYGMHLVPSDIKVSHSSTFFDKALDPRMLEAMIEGNAAGILPVSIFYQFMVGAGGIPEDMSIVEFKEQLKDKSEFVTKVVSTQELELQQRHEKEQAKRSEVHQDKLATKAAKSAEVVSRNTPIVKDKTDANTDR